MENKSATIANFGIGPIYSHIIPVTANIQAKDKTFVIVESIAKIHAKITANNPIQRNTHKPISARLSLSIKTPSKANISPKNPTDITTSNIFTPFSKS